MCPEFAESLCEKIDAEKSKMNGAQRHQVYLFSQLFKFDAPKSLEEFKAEKQTESKSEVDFFAKIDPKALLARQYFIECTGSYVDGYDSATNTIILFDGPSHFLSNGAYNGSNSLLNKIWLENGYNVKRYNASGEITINLSAVAKL